MVDTVRVPGGGAAQLPVLRALVAALSDKIVRPWLSRELHNPWSRVSCDVDAWAMLDLCMTLGRLPQVADRIGADVILFDSALLPDRWDMTEQSAVLFPVQPLAGLTVLCGIAEPARITFTDGRAAIELAPGDLALISAAADWHVEAAVSSLFAARYFPATSRYCRDPRDPTQRAVMERLPLFNFATIPLWLVSGEDRAGNDFVTGFNPRPPYWSAPPDLMTL